MRNIPPFQLKLLEPKNNYFNDLKLFSLKLHEIRDKICGPKDLTEIYFPGH